MSLGVSPMMTNGLSKGAEPSGQWTFDLALNALKSPEDLERLKSLDQFFQTNKSVLTDPEIFLRKSTDAALPSGEEFTIRGSKYTVNSKLKKYAEEISEQVNVNKTEVLRVICEIVTRIPETEENKKEENKKKIASHEDTRLSKEEIHQLYTFGVLKEKRTVLQLTRFILANESLPVIQDKYSTDLLEDSQYIDKMLTVLESLITDLETTENEHIKNEHALTIAEVLKTLTNILIKVSTTDVNVTKWFKLMEKTQFPASFSDKLSSDVNQEIQALTSIVTLLFFGLNTKDDIFDPSAPFASQATAVKSIHETLSNSPHNAIALYAWSIVLFTLPEEVLTTVFPDTKIEEMCKSLAALAVELQVFQTIDQVHKILAYDSLYSAILSSFLICTVPFIQLTDTTSTTYYNVLKDAPNTFIEKFFTNPNTERLLHVTKAKFPEVLTPYLRLLSINGAYAHNALSSMTTYMSMIPTGSMDYEIDPESDTITLRDGLQVRPPYEQNPDVVLFLPPETKGKLLPTADQSIEAAIFRHEYNGWSLVGRVLQNVVNDPEAQDLVLVIFELITNTLFAFDVDGTSEVLESLSAFLDDSDILDVILKQFELSLHQRNTLVLTQLTKLLIALTNTYPQIVWSHLVRSDLLEHGGRGGVIGTVLGSVDTVNGTYDFTIASLKLFNELVIDCLSGKEESYSHKLDVVPKLTNYAAQVFESFMYWTYKDPHQKFEIASLIMDAFSKLLYSVYAIDPENEPIKKVTRVLASSAKRVLTSFTVSLPDVRIIAPLIAAVDAMAADPTLFDSTTRLGVSFTEWAKSTLQFSKLVISIRTALGQSPSTLESSLFVKSPQLIMIYGKISSLRTEVLQLLTQLVSAPWANGSSPSLLSHLGDYYTGILLSALFADLKTLHDDFVVKKALYSFFSAVIEGNQKGLSMIFLNGRDIRDTSTDQPSLLKVLKSDVKNIDYYPDWLSIHLVDAIAYAFNSWSSRRKDAAEDNEFVKMLVKKLTESKLEIKDTADISDVIQGCYKYKLNARLAEICALVIFPSKQDTISQPIIDLLNSDAILDLIKPLYEPFAYQAALHDDLNRLFEEKWPGLKLENFIRSPLAITNRYGEGAVYDLRLLDGMLSDGPYWLGTELTAGYRADVIAASVNLQLVSSQISAAKSWGALLTAYVKKVNVQPSFIKIVKKLLQADIDEGTSISLFDEVYRARIELSFFLLHCSASQKSLEYEDLKEILDLSLQLITSFDVDFLSSLSANRSEVYRPLMRIIFKCLSGLKGETKIIEALTTELLEFFEVVIAKGSTVLFECVQSDGLTEIGGRIEDLMLIISLCSALLGCNPPTSFTSRLSTILVDFNTLKSILSVYASSHTLKVNDEVVFAELTLTYMIELVSVDVIAEQLIASGLFSTLIQSPISVTIQEGGIFVQTSPKLHNIWTNGLLSIILILLSKFGVRLLSEISAFVSYFSKQFASTIESWSQDSVAITIPALQETEQIIILQKALQSLYHEFGQSMPNTVPDTLEIVPGLDTESGRKTLTNSLNHLLAHPKYLTSRVIPTTVEEQRMFVGDDKIRTPLVELLASQITELKQALVDA